MKPAASLYSVGNALLLLCAAALMPFSSSARAQSPPGLNDGLLAHWSFSVPGELQNNDGVSALPVLRLIPDMDVNLSIGVFPNPAAQGSYGALKATSAAQDVSYTDVPGVQSPLLQPGAPAEWSVSTWFQAVLGGNVGTIFEVRPHGGDSNYVELPWISALIGNSKFSYRVSDNSGFIPLDFTIGPDWWHHLVIIKLAGPDEVRIYLDGSLAGSAFLPAPYSGYPSYPSIYWNQSFLLGGSHYESGGMIHQMEGALDDFRLYSRALSDANVASLYAQGVQTQRIASTFTLANLLGTALGAQDTDGDGYSNLTEFLAGTSILSPTNHPTLLAVGGAVPALHTKIDR